MNPGLVTAEAETAINAAPLAPQPARTRRASVVLLAAVGPRGEGTLAGSARRVVWRESA